jgi:predicted nucleic acid-binding protein
MYLLDTDVVSALRRPDRNRHVVEWVAANDPNTLYLSTATIAEIERGAHRQLKKNPSYALELSRWLDGVISHFGERILPINVPIARRWGALSSAMGHDDLDLAIAATAMEHNLTVATRNVRDFIRTGVAIYDPFDAKLHKPK